jgi:lipid A 3-O-deacylase
LNAPYSTDRPPPTHAGKFSINRISPNNTKTIAFVSLAVLALAGQGSARAEADLYSITWDNDALVGTDNGYTAGVYFSWFDTSKNSKPGIGWLAGTMAWSLPNGSKTLATGNVKTIGQTMMTPDDIELEDPPEDDLPYAGLLYYSETYVERTSVGYSDKISVTIGVVGEYSFAEDTQKTIHDMIGSAEPRGWDTQIDDEIVFQFSRGRVWQSWKSASGRQDFLLGANVTLGTLSSSAGTSIMWRYGEQLDQSYGTTMLASGRSTNPVATETGWYWFAGAGARYMPNMIFLDGNTYKDSRKVDDWDHEQISVTAGFAYSSKNWSLTYAINNMNIISNDDNDAVDEYSRYGTITYAWWVD